LRQFYSVVNISLFVLIIPLHHVVSLEMLVNPRHSESGTDCLSVLPPPPPRYQVPVAYAAGAANGMPVPIIETNNVITHPEGGCPLQVGEGAFAIDLMISEEE
jgi:hypothetical protein